jgi:DNA-binding NtrC family response regulator
MKTGRILVVDDDEAIRSAIRRALEYAGHAVGEANNGHDALAKLAAEPYDVVITDLIMPDSDGLELTFKMRRIHPGLHVIAISGGGRMPPERYLELARSAGAAAGLAKPFLMDQLLTVVESMLAPKQ